MPRVVCFTLKCSTWSPVLKMNPRTPIRVSTHILVQWHTVMFCAQVLLLLVMEFSVCPVISVFAVLANAQQTSFAAAFTQSRFDGHPVAVTFCSRRRPGCSMRSMPLPHQFHWARFSTAISKSVWMRCAASSATVAHPKKATAALPRSDQRWTLNRSVDGELPESTHCTFVTTATEPSRRVDDGTSQVLHWVPYPREHNINTVVARSNRCLTSGNHVTLNRQSER